MAKELKMAIENVGGMWVGDLNEIDELVRRVQQGERVENVVRDLAARQAKAAEPKA